MAARISRPKITRTRTNTIHSHPCAVVPDPEALKPEKALKPETLTVNHGRNSEISRTSDASPATWSPGVHCRTSNPNAGAVVAGRMPPPAASDAGPPAGLAAGPASRAPHREHTAAPSTTLLPHCEQNMNPPPGLTGIMPWN